jgi:hypothetical protein
MITHLVFFKMLPEAEGASGEENASTLVGMLQALPASIPELVKLEAGTDFSRSPASFDVGLVTHFKSAADLESYRVHTEHQKVVAFVQKTTSARAVVDYESL